MENYLSILGESFKQKIQVLDEILQFCDKQEQILREDKFSLEEFDVCMEQKQQLIERLEKLDDGFEAVYNRVREQLVSQKEQYKEQIASMQDMIRTITEKSTSIQVKENRNKQLLENQIGKQRRNINNGKRNTTEIYKKYHNMNGAVDARFMDQKK